MTGTDAIEAILTRAGFAGARRVPLAGDASSRRYERLFRADGATAMLTLTPDPAADLIPFVRIGAILARHGFSVPAILAADPEAGLAVQEDFGDDTFTRQLDRGADAGALYALAVDALIELHRRIPGGSGELAGLAPFSADYFIDQAGLFADVHAPLALGRPLDAGERAGFDAAWRAVVEPACAGPWSLVLRDFHVDNAMILPRDGVRAAGLIDFQNAGPGPVAYDLVSLLEDARRDVDGDLAEAMIRRYLDAFPGLDAAAFRRSYAVLGAVRHTRIVGIFERLAVRGGRRGYLAHLPRVWRLLEAKLADPVLAPVAQWFDRTIPVQARGSFAVPEAEL